MLHFKKMIARRKKHPRILAQTRKQTAKIHTAGKQLSCNVYVYNSAALLPQTLYKQTAPNQFVCNVYTHTVKLHCFLKFTN